MRKIADAILSVLRKPEDNPLSNIVQNCHDHYKNIDQLLHVILLWRKKFDAEQTEPGADTAFFRLIPVLPNRAL